MFMKIKKRVRKTILLAKYPDLFSICLENCQNLSMICFFIGKCYDN